MDRQQRHQPAMAAGALSQDQPGGPGAWRPVHPAERRHNRSAGPNRYAEHRQDEPGTTIRCRHRESPPARHWWRSGGAGERSQVPELVGLRDHLRCQPRTRNGHDRRTLHSPDCAVLHAAKNSGRSPAHPGPSCSPMTIWPVRDPPAQPIPGSGLLGTSTRSEMRAPMRLRGWSHDSQQPWRRSEHKATSGSVGLSVARSGQVRAQTWEVSLRECRPFPVVDIRADLPIVPSEGLKSPRARSGTIRLGR